MEKYNFQYCQKIVILSEDKTKVLLCKRFGEIDHDGIFSFIGGKMETTDLSLIEGLKREKNEEVGSEFKIMLYPTFCFNVLFKKKDGNAMILPHYLAIYKEGKIDLNNNEYSEYKWVKIDELDKFEPKISTIPEVVSEILRLEKIAGNDEYILI